MTKKQITAPLFVLAVVAVVTSLATAQSNRITPHESLPPLMKVLDLDRNGVLSYEEVSVATKVLRKLDTNGDGFIMMNEVVLSPPKSNKQLSKYMMKKDKNGDGKLSKAELGERFARMFEESDKNKDGLLTQKEILFSVDKLTTKPVGAIKGE